MSHKEIALPDTGEIIEKTLKGIIEDETFGDQPAPIDHFEDLYLDEMSVQGTLEDEDAIIEDLWSLEFLTEVRHRLEAQARAVRTFKAAVDLIFALKVGEGGKVVLGPEFYQVKKKTSFRIKEDRVSDFWAAVGEALERAAYSDDFEEAESYRNAVRALFNPNSVRKGGLRALADVGIEFVDQATGELESVFDLFETIPDDSAPLEVSSMPVEGSKTPKFVSDLPPGEVRYGRGLGTTERPS